MNNLAFAHVYDNSKSNIIQFSDIKRNDETEDKPKKPSPCAGRSSEVYAFRTEEEIKAMIDVFDKHIEEADTDNHRQIASRNKLLFVLGINLGIRASDLHTLKWEFFFDKNNDGALEFKDFYSLQPKKQRKQKKFVKLFFNDAVKKAIMNYVAEYPFDNPGEYLFASRKGSEPINTRSLWRIIKQTAAEAGIKQNIGSHSLRKTWARSCFEQASDKTKAVVMLQQALAHSDQITTLRYIGILDEDIEGMYSGLNLGFDFI